MKRSGPAPELVEKLSFGHVLHSCIRELGLNILRCELDRNIGSLNASLIRKEVSKGNGFRDRVRGSRVLIVCMDALTEYRKTLLNGFKPESRSLCPGNGSAFLRGAPLLQLAGGFDIAVQSHRGDRFFSFDRAHIRRFRELGLSPGGMRVPQEAENFGCGYQAESCLQRSLAFLHFLLNAMQQRKRFEMSPRSMPRTDVPSSLAAATIPEHLPPVSRRPYGRDRAHDNITGRVSAALPLEFQQALVGLAHTLDLNES
jgi:hypothetical protein